jgi:transcriptional regulator with XRE-family HTH domain
VKEIGLRIKEALVALGMKQTTLAEQINVAPGYVSLLCSGRRTPSDRTIHDTAESMGVNETWLRTGEGEMFIPRSRSQVIMEFTAELMQAETEDFRRRFVEMLAGLEPEQWQLLADMAEQLSKKKE